jgi:simple sugar transport system permease protein
VKLDDTTAVVLKRRILSNLPDAVKKILTYVMAIAIAFLLIGVLFAVTGYNPFKGLSTLVTTSFKSSFAFWETINKFIPLLFATFAFAIPFKLRVYNIGALGQMQIGGIVAIIVTFELAILPSYILIPISLLFIMIAGGLYAAVCGWLRNRYDINPIISTVMLNFVSHYLLLFFTTGSVYADPFSGHPMTNPVPENATMPVVGHIPTSFYFAIIMILFLYVLMKRSRLGYKIEATGFNRIASRIYGINVPGLVITTLFVGGAMAGLSGAIQVMAVQKRLIEGFAATSGADFGTFGILTALIARGESVAIPAAAFFMSVLLVGADAMQRTLQIPVEMVFLMQSVMVIVIVLFRKRLEPRF